LAILKHILNVSTLQIKAYLGPLSSEIIISNNLIVINIE